MSKNSKTILLFLFAGPPIGALPFLIKLKQSSDLFYILLFMYPFGILPALVTSVIFLIITPKILQKSHYKELICGALSGLITTLFFMAIFDTIQSIQALVLFSIIGLIAGGACGHLSRTLIINSSGSAKPRP